MIRTSDARPQTNLSFDLTSVKQVCRSSETVRESFRQFTHICNFSRH